MTLLGKYKWVVAAVVAVACLLTAVYLFLPSGQEKPALSSPQTTTASVTTPASLTETTATETASTTDTTQSGQQTTTAFTTTTAAPKVKLTVTSHPKLESTTDEPITTFTGTSDPKHPLTINGKAVKRDELGAFSVEYELKLGKNTFVFSHKGKQTTYTVHYRYVVMQSYSPAGSRQYSSGAKFSVVVSARVGSTVTATFRGKTITLKQAGQGGDGDAQQSETFENFYGTFTLPSDNTKDLNLGVVTSVCLCEVTVSFTFGAAVVVVKGTVVLSAVVVTDVVVAVVSVAVVVVVGAGAAAGSCGGDSTSHSVTAAATVSSTAAPNTTHINHFGFAACLAIAVASFLS